MPIVVEAANATWHEVRLFRQPVVELVVATVVAAAVAAKSVLVAVVHSSALLAAAADIAVGRDLVDRKIVFAFDFVNRMVVENTLLVDLVVDHCRQ